MKRRLRMLLAIILSVAMMLSVTPTSSFNVDAASFQIEGLSEQESGAVISENSDKSTAGDADEILPNGGNMPAFSETEVIDGIKIEVSAPEGVFPEGSLLKVEKVEKAQQKKVDAAVEESRSEGKNAAISYTFDIKVLDKDGNEIQPSDGKNVKVSFDAEEVKNKNLNTDIYHITEENTDKLSAEVLDTTVEGSVAMAETDGFSYYTVEFTYDEKQYVMNGDTTVALSEILDYVGLAGEVTEVSVSNEDLFSASKENGIWTVTAHQAFQTDEWMKVCVDGVEYEIKVTDAVYYNNGANYTLGLSNSGDIYVKGVSHNLGTIRVSEDNKQPGNGISLLFADVTIDANGQLKYAYRNVEYAYNIPNVKELNGKTYTASLSGSNNAWVAHVDNMYAIGAVAYFTQTYYNPTYKVTYNTNAGSDSVTGIGTNPVTVSQGSSTTLPTPVRSGYTFEGWYTADSGGDKKGAGGDSFTPTADINLYAHWSLTAANAPTISSISGTNLTFGYSSGSISVSVPAISGHSISYQWYKRGTSSSGTGTAISGATSSSYNIETGLNANTYYYYCVVTSKRNDNNQTKSTTSGNAIVTVSKAGISPVISMSSWTYGETANNPSVTSGNPGGATPTYEYFTNETCTTKTSAANGASSNGAKPSYAGNYYVKATFPATTNYNSETAKATFKIAKKAITITADSSDKVYDGTALTNNSYTYTPLALGDSITSVTVSGSQTNVGSSANVPSAAVIKKGTADVTSCYSITYANGTLKVTKASSSILTAPTAKNLTYTSANQKLVNVGNVSGGTIKYAVTQNPENIPGDYLFSENIPEKTDAGTYYVWWMVAGDANHNDTACELSNKVEVKIKKADINPTVSLEGWIYGNNANSPVVLENPGEGNITYTYYTDEECKIKTGTANNASSAGDVPGYAGIYYVKASVEETANYNSGETDRPARFEIRKRNITVSGITAQTKTYDGNKEADLIFTTITLDGKMPADTLGVAAEGKFADKNVGSLKKVTIDGLELTGDLKDNYTLENTTQQTECTASITPKEAELEWTGTSLVYNGSSQQPAATVSNKALAADDINVTVTGAETNAGVYTATAAEFTGADANNYSMPEKNTRAYAIAKANADVEVSINDWTYGDNPEKPVIEGVPKGISYVVEYKKSNAKNSAYTDKVPTDAGDYNIRVKAEANDNYNVTTVVENFTINPKVVTLTWNGESFVYDGNDHLPTAVISEDSLVDGDTCTVTVTGAASSVGTHTATAIRLSNANYKLPGNDTFDYKIVAKDIEDDDISLKLDSWTYGDTANRPVLTGNESGAEVTYEYAKKEGGETGAYTSNVPSKAGDYVVRATIAATADYNQKVVTADFTIKKKVAEISWSDTSLKYTGEPQEPKAEITNLEYGDKVEFLLNYKAKGAEDSEYTETMPADAGEYTAKIVKLLNAKNGSESNPETGDADNYELPAEAETDFTIARGMLVPEVTINNWTYGDTPNEPEVKGISEGAAVTYTYYIDKECAAATNAENSGAESEGAVPAFAGEYTVKAVIAASGSYEGGEATADFSIEKKTAELTWADTSFTYDGAEHIPTAAVANPVAGDELTVELTGAATAAGTHTAEVTKLSGDKAANYELPATTKTTYVIAKKAVTLTWKLADSEWDGTGESGLTAVYNGADQCPEVTVGNLAEGDKVEAKVTGAATAVGTHTAEVIRLTGEAAANYELPEKTEAAFTITKATLPDKEENVDGVVLVTSDWTYGDKDYVEPYVDGYEGEARITISYRKQVDSSDGGSGDLGEFSTKVPTDVGTYDVKAVIAGTPSVNEKTLTGSFKISPRTADLRWKELSFIYDGKEHIPV
ncbi:Listeria/Bacterioides repeat-containing protein, partial [Lachnospiraceae bacterium]